MNRLLLIAAAAALSGAGCLHVTPVGPMAKMLGSDEKKSNIEGAKPAPTDPVTVPAPKPVPPAMLVTPGEVSDQNPQDATKKLMEELEQDRRSMEAMPRPSEVSAYKGRQ